MESQLRFEIAALKQAQEDLRLKLKEFELQNRELLLSIREMRLELKQVAQQAKNPAPDARGSLTPVAVATSVTPAAHEPGDVEAQLELEHARASEVAGEADDPVQKEVDELVRQGIDVVNVRKDFPNAIEILSRAIALDPFENQAFFYRGVAHHFLKHYIEAMADFTTAAQHSPTGPVRTTSLYNIACGHSVLGNRGQAFYYLEKALNEGFRNFVHMREDPDLSSIRVEPRFEELLQRYEKSDEGT